MKRILLAAAVLAVTMSSCSKETLAPQATSDAEAVAFGTFVGNSTTKAGVATITTVQNNGFYVIAGFETDEDTDDSDNMAYENINSTFKPDFMYNQYVEYVDGSWVYSPIKYWPVSGQIKFYAYFSKKADIVEPTANDYEGAPLLKVTTPEVTTDQGDVLAAVKNSGNLSEATSVPVIKFNFNHILSQISFMAMLDETLEEETTVTITDVRFNYGGLYNSANYNIQKYSWDFSNATTFAEGATSENISDGKEYTYDMKRPDTFWNLNNSDLMLIPQEFDEEQVSVTITYTVETLDDQLLSGSSLITNVKTAYLPASITWEKGYKYTYQITIGIDKVEFSDSITVADWSAADDYVDVEI